MFQDRIHPKYITTYGFKLWSVEPSFSAEQKKCLYRENRSNDTINQRIRFFHEQGKTDEINSFIKKFTEADIIAYCDVTIKEGQLKFAPTITRFKLNDGKWEPEREILWQKEF